MVALCTDELKQNVIFRDNKDIIIIKPSVTDIINKVEMLTKNRKQYKKISLKCAKKVKKRYSYKAQMIPRIKLIKEIVRDIYYGK